ncbi:unnamed protein product, partial [marine sediment metagenome]
AEEIVAAIQRGVDDPRLKWSEQRNQVRVNLSNSVGASPSDPKQTVQGRTRRLRDELIRRMSDVGWRRVGNIGAVFEKGSP